VKEIACFVSPHGFGHATRAIAVVEALQRIQPDIHAHFFTTVPESLFKETLTNYSYHPVLVDIGLVQSSALDSDIPATIEQLDRLQPFAKDLIGDLAALCAKCSLILCDIAPIGIAVARHTGLPSILVENFTWDWIYQPYVQNYPQLQPHIQFLKKLVAQADYRIQTEPLCFPATRDLHCRPIFRRTKGNLKALREQLGYGDKKLVVVTMGGVFQQVPSYQNIKSHPNIHFLFTGQQETKQIEENISQLAKDSDIYHPDLLSIADVVVCKAGYSTVAECCQAGARVISIGRVDFPESGLLQSYLEKRLGAVSIKPEMYQDGSWIAIASELILRPKAAAATKNGADQVADFLRKLT
jgi:UDP:flavonoid glycosyltransferase YjiC (YdhE family)